MLDKDNLAKLKAVCAAPTVEIIEQIEIHLEWRPRNTLYIQAARLK